MDPAVHFFNHGASENRDPGPRFCTATYFAKFPDLRSSGENPLLHFERHAQSGAMLHPPYPEHLLVHPARDRAENQREAALDAENVAASRRSIDDLIAQLPAPSSSDGEDKVPRIFHFVYGFHSKGDIPYFGYMAILSALSFNPGWSAYYYCIHEPAGPNWDKVKSSVKVIKIADFEWFNGSRFHHYAHKADVVRMIVINRVGGVYLDIDTITRRSFEPLRNADFCMGVQAAGPNSAAGLCNAVMVGKPNAKFSTEWLSHYDYFRSKGRDDLWDFHSVKLPWLLMSRNPEQILVLDHKAFFYPLWNTIEKQLFTDDGYEKFGAFFETTYCHHLWHGGIGSFLNDVDDQFVRTSKSIYARIARQALELRG
jgi:hypothetical protein